MLIAWLLACGSTGLTASEAAPTPVEDGAQELGAYPLCEPSAVLPLDDGSMLVADNEGRPADPGDGEALIPSLWVVPPSGSPTPVNRVEAAQDVESLVRLDDELWVVGSLSRSKSCKVKAKRWEIHVHPVDGFTAAGVANLGPARVIERKKKDIEEIEGSVSGCTTVLFRGLAEGRPVCEAIVRAASSPSGQACDALNVEGAVAVDGRVWLGLRAPLVDGNAVLVRLAEGHDLLTFDRVRLLDLGGRGVRELVVDGDQLVGIAGTVLDGSDRSRLFSVPLAGLETGALPVTVLDPDLPSTAEGVRLEAGSRRYVLDGSTGDGPDRCEQPARILSRRP